MIKENQNYINGFQLFVDVFIIYFSFIVSHGIKFKLISGSTRAYSFGESLYLISFYVIICEMLYHWFDLYRSKRIEKFFKEVTVIINCNLLAVFIFITGLYLFKRLNFSRQILNFFIILSPSLTIGYRYIVRIILRKFRSLKFNQKHCLVIGTSNIARQIIRKIDKHPFYGYNIIGCVTPIGTMLNYKNESCVGYPIIGDMSNLESILNNNYLDFVIIAVDETESTCLGKIIHLCETAGIKTSIVPYYYKYIPARSEIDDIDGIPLINTRSIPLDNYFKALLKRLFDIFFSLFAIIITSPILVICAVITKLTSPGPIIFKQERIGLNRKPFYMYKFRSMKVQTLESELDKWTTANDPRKTKWGNFMRKTSLDELPQFFNVLKGDMSVVGPRPERPYFVKTFQDEIPRYMIKHLVRPGITGWAQVNGLRGDTSIGDRIDHDLYYIENWTFGFDLNIIFLTIFKGFINKNAY